MATPKLKTASAPAAPTRLLRPSGTAPAKQVTLKSATGKTITPKTAAPAEPKTAAPKAPKTAAPAPAPAPVAEPQVDEAAIAAAQAEAEAKAAAEAQAAAEAEAARLAQEEYERQMEEYNRQMEEYNRQMAALQAAEEQAAASAEAEEEQPAATAAATDDATEAAAAAQTMVEEEAPDAPTPTEKLRAAKGSKPKSNISVAGAKKKKKPAASSKSSTDMSEDEAAKREAYMQTLAEESQQTPIWKNKLFIGGAAALVVTIGVCTTMVVQKQAENARIQAHIDYTNSLLKRAQEINMKAVENLADAAKKNVDVTCTMADAKALMEVVIDPFVKGENGKPRYGARAEGVAQNACLLLGLAAEKDNDIRDMIFDSLGKNCNKIKPTLFTWLLQRIAISNAKGVNSSLKKLAQVVQDKKTAKPWMQKSTVLASIWECIGLRVSPADTPEIIALLKSDITDNKLAGNLCICLDNILSMMDDEAAKAKLGDDIFTGIPEKLRNNAAIVTSLARACSPKAKEYYMGQIANDKWKGASAIFIGAWGNDDILDFVLEQKEANKDDAKLQDRINSVIGTILAQNRERSVDTADKLLALYFDEPFADTSGIQDIINKTDSMSTLYIGDDHPDLPKLQEQLKVMEKQRSQKKQLITVLSTLHDHDWVIALLDRFVADKDEDIKFVAEQAKEKARNNAVKDAQMRDSYKSRDKE